MRADDDKVADVFLHPGESCFAGPDTRVNTLLGSCVAVTMWHPLLRIGGMCHFVLPNRADKNAGPLDGRYGDEALRILLAEAEKWGGAPQDFRINIFGGSNMVSGTTHRTAQSIGSKNIDCARRLCTKFNLRIEGEHTGGTGHRRVKMHLRNGLVWLRYSELSAVERGLSQSREVK